MGECDKNPDYMLTQCAQSCEAVAAQEGANSLDLPESFYDIKEKDANGREINYSSFRGKVVYIVNVASQCGYTASNYATFRQLAQYRDDPDGLEILIFPCNQFGEQEPHNESIILQFAERQQFNGIVMSKADVNGPETRPTFRFLKSKTGKRHINW
jgi:glutathione peroxidase